MVPAGVEACNSTGQVRDRVGVLEERGTCVAHAERGTWPLWLSVRMRSTGRVSVTCCAPPAYQTTRGRLLRGTACASGGERLPLLLLGAATPQISRAIQARECALLALVGDNEKPSALIAHINNFFVVQYWTNMSRSNAALQLSK